MTKQMKGRSFPSVRFYLTMCNNVKMYKKSLVMTPLKKCFDKFETNSTQVTLACIN